MKRRNAECGKLRRPIKRQKVVEGGYGSPIVYLKFLLLWVFILSIDYVTEFRFEFLWPFWLLIRSVYDSFKYQGLAFSVLFVCVAATSDMVCFFFIPVQWLLFLASTYVWMQYVWHTDRGVCLPTVILCLVFVYVEAAVRMREIKPPSSFHIDLCRPFAAHCIGYPVVTFGFGFKSYVGYRMRQRRQREVSKENEFYMELLQQALPPPPDPPAVPASVPITSSLPEKSNKAVSITPNESDGKLPNGLVANGVTVTPPLSIGSSTLTSKNNHRKSMDKGPDRDRNDSESRKASHNHAHTNGSVPKADDKRHTNGTASKPSERPEDKKSPANGTVFRTDEKKSTSNGPYNKAQDRTDDKKNSDLYNERVHTVNDLDLNEPDKEKAMKGWNNRSQEKVKGAGKLQEPPTNCLKEKKGRINKEPQESSYCQIKDELILRLESDIKRLKADLQASRQTESELRGQMNASNTGERAARSELAQLQGINDDLASRVHGLVAARQTDKQSLAAMEKRLNEERRQRQGCEAQLAAERKKKSQDESALQAMASALNKAECTESCRQRRRELDAENKTLRRDLKSKEDRLNLADRELQTLRQYKEAQSDAEILMSALSAMQEKNVHLENSLKAETRIKLDLFSALGEAKRQLEIRETQIRNQEKELEEMKGKMAQVLAVMPSEQFCSNPSTPLLQTTSKFRCFSTAYEKSEDN